MSFAGLCPAFLLIERFIMKNKKKELKNLIKLFKQFMNLNRKQQLMFISKLEKKCEEGSEL